jgi:hypothetical protein
MRKCEDFLDIFEGFGEIARFNVEHICDIFGLSGLSRLLEGREDTGG